MWQNDVHIGCDIFFFSPFSRRVYPERRTIFFVANISEYRPAWCCSCYSLVGKVNCDCKNGTLPIRINWRRKSQGNWLQPFWPGKCKAYRIQFCAQQSGLWAPDAPYACIALTKFNREISNVQKTEDVLISGMERLQNSLQKVNSLVPNEWTMTDFHE